MDLKVLAQRVGWTMVAYGGAVIVTAGVIDDIDIAKKALFAGVLAGVNVVTVAARTYLPFLETPK